MIGEPATLVLIGGRVLASTPQCLRDDGATAVAVRADEIIAVGTDSDIEPLIGAGTQVIALYGRAVLPGINDSHLHATWLGAMWPHTLFGGNGFGPALTASPLATRAQRRAAILRAGDICAPLGITSYTEPGLGPGEDEGETGCFSSEVLAEYVTLADEGLLKARVTALRLFGKLDGRSTLADFERGMAVPPPQARDRRRFAVTGVKIFADGIPPMRSAWTRHSYPDQTHGSLLIEGRDDAEREANLRAMIAFGAAAGAQVGVHATGDRTIDVTVDALAAAPSRGAAGPHYIVHGNLVTGATLTRMSKAGVGLTVQPGIAVVTREMMAAAVGAEVTATAWPLAAMLASGAPVTLSSDAPVLAPDWRAHVADAARLLGRTGTHPDLMGRLLSCYTTMPAVQDGAARWKGSIRPGQAADLCVLDQNPLTTPLAEATRLTVETTVVAGQVVFDRQTKPEDQPPGS